VQPRRPALILLAATALLAACGDDDEAAETGAAPTETTASSASTSADEVPERIVSLSPTATEMLFAIGAGDQVVAVDDQSDFPAEVPTTDLSAYEPNVEAIAAYEPDLVVISGGPDDLESGLEAIGADVLTLPAAVTLADTYDQIDQLGEVTGHVDEAAEVVAGIQADIEELTAEVPDRTESPTYYHELDDTLFSVTSQTFIGQIYELAGLANVADPADADGALGGYPQLSAEYLVAADPDFIFLADTECCAQDLATVAARPGFAGLTAVTEGRVVELSDDVASRWGPRVVDFLRAIVDATAEVPAG
jgi:iron complex transport system substrate-binding protein